MSSSTQQPRRSPAELVQLLRAEMKKRNVDAYLVPTADAHQSEYVADCDKRRAAITGFTGSAGTALVTDKTALLWTDGRYFLQASQELDAKVWTLMKSGMDGVPKMEEWLLQNMSKDAKVAFDPTVIPLSQHRRFQLTFENKISLVPIKENLVDLVWTDRPAPPQAPLLIHPDKYSGQTTTQKVQKIRDELKKNDSTALVVTALDEVAWLFNLRGGDIAFNPVFFSYGLVTMDAVNLYCDLKKVTEEVKAHLVGVSIKPYTDIFADLHALRTKPGRVLVDPLRVSMAVFDALTSSSFSSSSSSSPSSASAASSSESKTVATILEKLSPIQLMKAVKNNVELEGIRQAHIRDAAAVVNFLAWLEAALDTQDEKEGKLTECSVSDKLEQFRREQKDFVSLSFDTIAGSGPNGAIIHYKPEPASCRAVRKSDMFLLDSGAQYKDGTTDITRTMHFGAPTDFERRCYTRVLQGHIALARAVFPPNTPGPNIDCLARVPLWSEGLDYQHGTGHGVGAFLNVHEGPHGISATVREGSSAQSIGLEAGMICSNEPGYYHEGKFGIRIENLVTIVPAKTTNRFLNKQFLTFDNLTLVPLHHSLIDVSLLSPEEINWINEYHATCRAKVGPLVSGPALVWLNKYTQPISKN